MGEMLVLTGGIPRKNSDKYGHGHKSEYAEMLYLDTGTSEFRQVIKHKTESEYCAQDHPSVYFTSGQLKNNLLYVGTTTQCFEFSLTHERIIRTFNSRYMNDIHHIMPYREGFVAVATGLDAVLVMNADGELEYIIDVISYKKRNAERSDIDYRLIASTKPHKSHPNFVFEHNDELWVTRFMQKDAVCLSSPSKHISINIGNPHDGQVVGDSVFFTTVNGYVVQADLRSLKIIAQYDLNAFESHGKPLGWCRGLHIEEGGSIAYVGFSTLRKTKAKENIQWLKSHVKGEKYARPLPARVTKYNLEKGYIEETFDIPKGSMSIVFGVMKYEE